MDREILFRGKRIDNGEWIYGSLINNESVPRIIVNSEYSTGTTYVSYAPKIDSKTIGQFTGKYDNNDKKIFEWDIVKHKELNFYGIVRWFDILCWDCGGSNHSGFYCKEWMFGDCDHELSWPWGFDNCIVVGNIHDNPELLEKVVKHE